MAQIPGLTIDLSRVHTNIVYFDVVNGMSAAEFAERAKEAGVLVLPTAPQRIRAVTHYGIEAEDIEEALDVFSRIVG